MLSSPPGLFFTFWVGHPYSFILPLSFWVGWIPNYTVMFFLSFTVAKVLVMWVSYDLNRRNNVVFSTNKIHSWCLFRRMVWRLGAADGIFLGWLALSVFCLTVGKTQFCPQRKGLDLWWLMIFCHYIDWLPSLLTNKSTDTVQFLVVWKHNVIS